MSSGSTSAYSRVPVSTRIYQVTDAAEPVKIANDRDELFSNSSTGPSFDENGEDVTGGIGGAWTGTGASGAASGVDCSAWTTATNPTLANTGAVGSTNSGWFYVGTTACGTTTLHIYCIGI
jgi:hypothetical protein